MKKNVFTKVFTLICIASIAICSMSSCGGNSSSDNPHGTEYYPQEEDTVSYRVENTNPENDKIYTADNPVSTFSADVDTASYTLFRNLVNNGITYGTLLENYAGWFRTEEFINYFKYSSYKEAEEDELFGVNASVIDCPWNADRSLLILGLAADSTIPETVSAGNNYVFLIDVSGSMASQNKLPLLKKSIEILVNQLGEDDLISIVSYAGREEVVLEACPASDKKTIMDKVNGLRASGSTAGEAGLSKAYEIAGKYFIENGNNRIILASDGDLNVGISSVNEIKAFVAEKKETGVYLSVLGFGSGNFRDSIMEAIADNGNGAYYYVDTIEEAEKIFGSDFNSTMYTVGTDVKMQLTFNSSAVISYRQVGYENRQLAEQDFTDDSKDAGDVGAGHRVTVIYELELADGAADNAENLLCDLAIRYKKPGEDESTLQERAITAAEVTKEASKDSILASAVAEAALLLRGSEYVRCNDNLLNILTIICNLESEDESVAEFAALLSALIGTEPTETNEPSETNELNELKEPNEVQTAEICTQIDC